MYLRRHLVLEPWGTLSPQAIAEGTNPSAATAQLPVPSLRGFCHECGAAATPGDAFCRACGTRLEAPVASRR